ncbi:MAG: signal peptidase I [Oscillospiraceae bacterium]
MEQERRLREEIEQESPELEQPAADGAEKDAAAERGLNKEEAQEPGRWLYDWLQPLCAAFVALTLLLTFVTPVLGVVGPSMRDTLQSGDRLLAVKNWLCGDFRQGDIVIARKDSFDSQPIVKRVIAVGGQTVDIDFTTGAVMVDGEVLQEDYIRELTFLEEGTVFPLTVPEGSVFLMGDNRNNSSDSRDSALGTVDERYIIGRAVLLLFPGEDPESGERDFSRIGLIH